MERFLEVSQEIVDFVNHPEQKTLRLINAGGTRFVVCGTSGSGKSRAIEHANSFLPVGEQIAESQELLREKDPLNALIIVNDAELKYEASEHIGFNIIGSALAKNLEIQGVKVFWLDNGSSRFP